MNCYKLTKNKKITKEINNIQHPSIVLSNNMIKIPVAKKYNVSVNYVARLL